MRPALEFQTAVAGTKLGRLESFASPPGFEEALPARIQARREKTATVRRRSRDGESCVES